MVDACVFMEFHSFIMKLYDYNFASVLCEMSFSSFASTSTAGTLISSRNNARPIMEALYCILR
jgi:hypothetical protein